MAKSREQITVRAIHDAISEVWTPGAESKGRVIVNKEDIDRRQVDHVVRLEGLEGGDLAPAVVHRGPDHEGKRQPYEEEHQDEERATAPGPWGRQALDLPVPPGPLAHVT